jgi:hypothetical protein
MRKFSTVGVEARGVTIRLGGRPGRTIFQAQSGKERVVMVLVRKRLVRTMKVAALAGLALAAACASSAQAQVRDPVTGLVSRIFTFERGQALPAQPRQFGGGSCAGAEGHQVWWGRFGGGSYARVSRRSAVYHYAEGCFPSRSACESWMLALKTDFGNVPRFNQCRAGYEPGAPVVPWWLNVRDGGG